MNKNKMQRKAKRSEKTKNRNKLNNRKWMVMKIVNKANNTEIYTVVVVIGGLVKKWNRERQENGCLCQRAVMRIVRSVGHV